jgi:hypothetical protein
VDLRASHASDASDAALPGASLAAVEAFLKGATADSHNNWTYSVTQRRVMTNGRMAAHIASVLRDKEEEVVAQAMLELARVAELETELGLAVKLATDLAAELETERARAETELGLAAGLAAELATERARAAGLAAELETEKKRGQTCSETIVRSKRFFFFFSNENVEGGNKRQRTE